MLQKFTQALAKMAVLTTEGGKDPRPARVPSVIDMPIEEVKRQVPGTILLLNSGKYGVVPCKRGVVLKDGVPTFAVLDEDKHDAATLRSAEWMDANVDKVWLGVLVDGAGGAGCHAKLRVGGAPATLAPKLGAPMAGLLSVAGGEATAKDFNDCLQALGIDGQGRRWAGGMVPPAAATGPGLLTQEQAALKTIPVSRAHGCRSAASASQLLCRMQLHGSLPLRMTCAHTLWLTIHAGCPPCLPCLAHPQTACLRSHPGPCLFCVNLNSSP